MLQARPTSLEDPFDGLLLPMEVWKAVDDAHITSLEQLKALTPLIGQMPGIDPEAARIIEDRLARLAARRTARVRLVFPKRPHRERGRRGAQGNRQTPIRVR
jgi:hypothetical protein